MAAQLEPAVSPFRREGDQLEEGKFAHPEITKDGTERALVPMFGLDTLWFNTGTLCNLSCAGCYIESSPVNDALVYITTAEVERYLDEIERDGFGTKTIAFTGGEPFMNRDMLPIIEMCLERGFHVLILTNAMRPMQRFAKPLAQIISQAGERLVFRVSLDHHTQDKHEAERGKNSWDKALEGLRWLREQQAQIAVAGRQLADESLEDAQAGYAALFRTLDLAVDVTNPEQLVLFPEMDATLDTPEISEACWGILNLPKQAVMCSSSRMVVKRKGEATTRVAACTLLPYDEEFDLGESLAEASQSVRLNHPHCSRFCVLGGASCSG
ncbi:MAG: radical SAM protein [Pseudomonadota bacterium]